MPTLPGVEGLDLPTLGRLYQAGTLTPLGLVTGLLQRLAAYPDPALWIHRVPADRLCAQADGLPRRRAGGAVLPLYGVPFAVKDNMDVAGCPTSAGCPAFTYQASATAPVVARLQEAGALLVGKTNLDQFATGLAGDRSPYGACRNPFHPDAIPGGSSSGSAVAVAAGLVSFALGTDTAGSGRVPAGCNNIVGLKPTTGLLDTAGVVPACRSLDCISVFALTAEDALRVGAVGAGGAWPESQAATSELLGAGFAFATPRDEDLEFFGDEGQERLFAQALERLAQMGGRRIAVDFRTLRQVAGLLYEGPWLAERLAGLEGFLAEHAADMHPVTRQVIQGGSRYSAVDLFKGLHLLKGLRERCAGIFDQAEVLVVPTMPALPTLAEVQADSVSWNRRLGYYTNFVNLLGWAALAVPAGFTSRGLPGGITLVGPAGSEPRLGTLGMAWQRRLNLPLGATKRTLPERPPALAEARPGPPAEGWVRVAVAGAHLRGQPLHAELRRTGACFVRACRTAPRYRFVGLLDLDPPRPGLLRDEARAGSAAVEIYDLPLAGFGRLVASVAPPLAIGTIELADGEAVKGFLCESWAAQRGRDITDFGGWVAYRTHLGFRSECPPEQGRARKEER
jgi:allophanate hydrolase